MPKLQQIITESATVTRVRIPTSSDDLAAVFLGYGAIDTSFGPRPKVAVFLTESGKEFEIPIASGESYRKGDNVRVTYKKGRFFGYNLVDAVKEEAA